jgi:hypothetical protein
MLPFQGDGVLGNIHKPKALPLGRNILGFQPEKMCGIFLLLKKNINDDCACDY